MNIDNKNTESVDEFGKGTILLESEPAKKEIAIFIRMNI